MGIFRAKRPRELRSATGSLLRVLNSSEWTERLRRVLERNEQMGRESEHAIRGKMVRTSQGSLSLGSRFARSLQRHPSQRKEIVDGEKNQRERRLHFYSHFRRQTALASEFDNKATYRWVLYFSNMLLPWERTLMSDSEKRWHKVWVRRNVTIRF